MVHVLQLRLEQRQTQKIVITPQLRQAIKLLQLSAIELQSYIENEIRENPLLSPEERSDNDGASEAHPEIAVTANGEADVPAFDARDVSEVEIGADWEPETPGDRALEGESASTFCPCRMAHGEWFGAVLWQRRLRSVCDSGERQVACRSPE